MCKKKYEKHRNVLVFFLRLRNARCSYFSETVLRNPKHWAFGSFGCKQWPIFPGRRQPSIVGTEQLNYRVRNGNGWTLHVKITYYRILCWHWPIFPDRRQSSIVGTVQLNYRVRNGYGWTLHVNNTNSLSWKKVSKELSYCYRASFLNFHSADIASQQSRFIFLKKCSWKKVSKEFPNCYRLSFLHSREIDTLSDSPIVHTRISPSVSCRFSFAQLSFTFVQGTCATLFLAILSQETYQWTNSLKTE